MFFRLPVVVVSLVYLTTLLLLGWRGYRQRKEGSLSDFYLAGSTLGFVVLFSTLFATQYSGNTFLGYTGQAYRVGFGWTFSVGMMMSVVIVYLLFAPALYRDSRLYGCVTPADWVARRFEHRGLTLVVSLIMAFALLNYLYAQFLALGHFVAGMSGGQVPYWVGVVLLGLVIGVYESLGGMRSVAWTDVVQGTMLFVGLGLVLVMAWPQVGSLAEVTRHLAAVRPALVEPPGWEACASWASSMVLLGLGAAMYPHAIQRIYAARDAATLRRSLRVMVFMPFATTLVVLVIGIAAHAVLGDGIDRATDRVMPAFLATLGGDGGPVDWGVALVMVGALAAMMSTADSALLSLSSILTVDLIGGVLGRQLSEATLARVAKLSSWGIVVVLTAAALQPPATLWRLIEIKMELLIQVGPVFVLGVRSQRLTAEAAWRALLAAATLVFVALSAGIDKVAGVHIGTWACALNFALCGWSMRRRVPAFSRG